jgi:hypothetical protein
MPTFVAQRISQKNNVLFPDKITIEGLKVTYYKGEIIGYKSSVIYMGNIASVSINENIFLPTWRLKARADKGLRQEALRKRMQEI